MQNDFITVSEAQSLTGKSERTIRRFLKANVTEHCDHFEMETHNGREVWLIDPAFLETKYPFKHDGKDGTVTSPDNAGGTGHGSKNLREDWQKSKQKERDRVSEDSEENGGERKTDHVKVSGTPVTGDTTELWKLIHAQQDEIKKKDEQLDRYFTGQQEMMQTLGRLMEQDNLLLARSQEASLPSMEKESDVATEIVEVDVANQSMKKARSKAKNNDNFKADDASVNETTKTKRGWFGGLFGA